MLGEAEAELRGEPDYRDALVELIAHEQPSVGIGATWLLKSHLEQGGKLSVSQTRSLFAKISQLSDWSAQLHICQSIRLLDLPPDQAGEWVAWLSALLAHDRPFLRAWALDAIAHIAQLEPQYREQFEAALRDAKQDKAASVRARARNL